MSEEPTYSELGRQMKSLGSLLIKVGHDLQFMDKKYRTLEKYHAALGKENEGLKAKLKGERKAKLPPKQSRKKDSTFWDDLEEIAGNPNQ